MICSMAVGLSMYGRVIPLLYGRCWTHNHHRGGINARTLWGNCSNTDDCLWFT